jgi:DNA-binding transcriptional MerR regulator
MTIGEFSRRSQLSLKALRLYERLGLLRPVAVDQRNGYRRYRESQLYTARLIVMLRLLDMPLPEVSKVVSASRNEGFVIFHGMVTTDSDGPVEVCVPVSHPPEDPAELAWRVEPAHREAFISVTNTQVPARRIKESRRKYSAFGCRLTEGGTGPAHALFSARAAHSAKGLKTSTPAGSKSLTLRVTTVRPCTPAVAAMSASITRRGRACC